MTAAMTTVQRIAILGSGPRGMSVLERLAARLIAQPSQDPVTLYLIDDGHVGTGRIWRPDQSPTLLMNTIAQEISAFSGAWDGQPARPGCGPSFGQWWQAERDDYEAYGGYAPRAYYGQYLLYVLDAVERALPAHVSLRRVSARVRGLEEHAGGGQTLLLADGASLAVDVTVLATGHAQNRPQGLERKLGEFAAATPGFRFHAGDSVADIALDEVMPGQAVGVIGMGLSFYDLMAEFTLGRGGSFVEAGCGKLTYLPSGREPRLYASSRSGMPVPPRGRNQKPADYEYTPAIFTLARARSIRARGPVNFERDALPLLEAELSLMHAETRLRQERSADAAATLRRLALEQQPLSVAEVQRLAAGLGLADPVAIDCFAMAAPFLDRRFDNPAHFSTVLTQALEEELAEAQRGNVDSPLKAAQDVIRNSRTVIRAFADFGGLDPASHRDFLQRFSPVSGFLSAGPPVLRIRQMLALMRAGLVTVLGPAMQIEPSPGEGCVHMYSPAVKGSEVALQMVIDARIPTTAIGQDRSELSAALLAQGTYRSFVNGEGEHAFDTGGVDVTASPFHPVRADRSVARGLYVLGIPTEHTRWFMQSGSSRPHKWIDFMIDADAIAADILNPKESP